MESQSRKLIALITFCLSAVYAHAQPNDSSACTDATSSILLTNRATLDAQTRLFKIEASSATSVRAQAYEVAARDGKLGRSLWQSQMPSEPLLAIEPSHAAARNAPWFDAVFIGSVRLRSAVATDSSYAQFAQVGWRRNPTLYIATNEGQLFRLNAETGESAQIRTALTEEQRRATVGSTLATAAILIGDEWRTLLVALSQADQSVLHGIDATDPDNSKLLWSQTLEAGGTLTQSRRTPVIARLNHHSAVMVGANGALHIHDAASGAKLRVLTVASSVDSLTDPLAVDVNHDGNIERAYAGDNQGNIWRFDLSSADPQQWHVAFGGRPLVTVTGQDGSTAHISERPEIALSQDARTPIVLFAARLNSGLAFLGAYDRDEPIATSTISSWGTRAVADTQSLEPHETTRNRATGWRRDLHSSNGMLTVSAPRVHDGQVAFTVAASPRDATCRPSMSELVAFSIEDGNSPLDAKHNSGDASVERLKAETHTPVILDQLTPSGSCLRHYYLGFDGAEVVQETRRCRTDTFGRQSWRQLR